MSTTINIPVINKSSNKLPEYAHEGDAGFDFRANVEEIKNDDYLFNTTKPSATTIIINIWKFLRVMNSRFVLVAV